MKEAIRCDIACVKPFLPMLISTVVVIDAIWLYAGNSFNAVAASVTMMTLLMFLSLAGYDGQSGWARFRATLPISRRSLIAGRYAVVLGFGFCAIALCVPLAIAVDSIASNAVVFEQATALFYAGVVSLAAALLLCSFVMPLVTLFGTVRGMRFFACGIGAFAAVVVVLLGRLLPPSVVSTFVESIEANLLLAVAASIVVALALYGVSCMVCTRIYCRRDL